MSVSIYSSIHVAIVTGYEHTYDQNINNIYFKYE
jgi:hypothetical protein